MYSNTIKSFFIPSYTIGEKELQKIDNLFRLFKKVGVFDLIDQSLSKDYSKGGRPPIDKYKLFVLIVYAYAFRHISLREMEAFCKFDLRAINDGKSAFKYWTAPEDLQAEAKKKPSAKRLSNKANKKKKEAVKT